MHNKVLPRREKVPKRPEKDAKSSSGYEDDSATLSGHDECNDTIRSDEDYEGSEEGTKPAKAGRKLKAELKAEGAPAGVSKTASELKANASRLKQAERAVCHRRTDEDIANKDHSFTATTSIGKSRSHSRI